MYVGIQYRIFDDRIPNLAKQTYQTVSPGVVQYAKAEHRLRLTG